MPGGDLAQNGRMPASIVIAIAVGIVLVVCALLLVRRVRVPDRGRATAVVSAWSRHPATRPTRTVRLLRDPDEVATAARRAAEHERETARQISARADRISRLSDRTDPGDDDES
jgi:hypothetical protein